MARVSQIPAELHVTIYQGDAWSIDVDCSLDLTGYALQATVHHNGTNDETALEIIETDLANGQYTIRLPAAASAELPADYHSWCHVLTPPYDAGDPDDLPLPRSYIAGRFIVEACE